MRITEITVMKGATINTGNYENRKVEVTMTGQISPDEDGDHAYEMLVQAVDERLALEISKASRDLGRW